MTSMLIWSEILAEENLAVQCSYEVAYQIAKCTKPHTVAENDWTLDFSPKGRNASRDGLV